MSYGKFLDEVGELGNWRRSNGLLGQDYDKNLVDLRGVWIKEKRYSELINFINENWDSGNGDDFFNPLSKHLVEEKELKHFKKLWKGILRHRINNFWKVYKYIFQEFPEIALKEIETIDISDFNQFSSEESLLRRFAWNRKYILKGLKQFKEGLIDMNDIAEVAKTKKLYQSFYYLNKPVLKKAIDKRKIDESLFWELIDLNRDKSEDKMEFIENLSNQLEEFKPTEIRRFERMFLTKYEKLNRWEIWALAYIVRRGCGDDAFDYFKSWVISKGKKAFEDINTLDFTELKQHFKEEDPQLEEMLWLSENVYENKTGELMPPVRVKKQNLLGEPWSEENLENEFPKIWRIFNHKTL